MTEPGDAPARRAVPGAPGSAARTRALCVRTPCRRSSARSRTRPAAERAVDALQHDAAGPAAERAWYPPMNPAWRMSQHRVFSALTRAGISRFGLRKAPIARPASALRCIPAVEIGHGERSNKDDALELR